MYVIDAIAEDLAYAYGAGTEYYVCPNLICRRMYDFKVCSCSRPCLLFWCRLSEPL
jgi:hypothetical protein